MKSNEEYIHLTQVVKMHIVAALKHLINALYFYAFSVMHPSSLLAVQVSNKH